MATVIGQAWSQQYGTMEVEQVSVCTLNKCVQLSGYVTPDDSDESAFRTLYFKDFQFSDENVDRAIDAIRSVDDLPF